MEPNDVDVYSCFSLPAWVEYGLSCDDIETNISIDEYVKESTYSHLLSYEHIKPVEIFDHQWSIKYVLVNGSFERINYYRDSGPTNALDNWHDDGEGELDATHIKNCHKEYESLVAALTEFLNVNFEKNKYSGIIEHKWSLRSGITIESMNCCSYGPLIQNMSVVLASTVQENK